MPLELLLATGCWFSNSIQACTAMGEQYYEYQHLDEVAKRIEKLVGPRVIFVASLLSSIENRKVSTPFGYGTHISIESPRSENYGYKYSLGWKYDF